MFTDQFLTSRGAEWLQLWDEGMRVREANSGEIPSHISWEQAEVFQELGATPFALL
jgi:hypothetical protein